MSIELLKRIASVLEFPESFFYRTEPLVTQAEYFYRKKASMSKKDLYQLEAQFDLIRLWFNELLSEIDIQDYSFPAIEPDAINSPEVIANKVRAFIQVPKGPIENLVGLLERNGIVVYFLNGAPDKFDGTTIITKSNHKIIVVNASMPNYRKRFTIAHELGHNIMHIPSSAFLDGYADVEKEANRFASEFLMPEKEIDKDVFRLTYSRLTDLKQYWKASKSSLIKRAADLKAITSQKYTSLMIELSRYDERREEKTDVYLDEPRMLNKIINVYLTDMGYSKDELKDFLALEENDFNKYILRNEKAVQRMKIAY